MRIPNAARLVRRLERNHMKIATAESMTGGLIAAAITAVPGASGVFEMGYCTYSNAVKRRYLGVSSETFEMHSEISAQCAAEMARGAALAAGADIAVSVTGLAGSAVPTANTRSRPAGIMKHISRVCSVIEGKHELPAVPTADTRKNRNGIIRRMARAYSFAESGKESSAATAPDAGRNCDGKAKRVEKIIGAAEKYSSASNKCGEKSSTISADDGTVYIGIHYRGKTRAYCFHFSGSRNRIRRLAAETAILLAQSRIAADKNSSQAVNPCENA